MCRSTSEQEVTVSPYPINRPIFITQTESVYCAVWTESFSTIYVELSP